MDPNVVCSWITRFLFCSIWVIHGQNEPNSVHGGSSSIFRGKRHIGAAADGPSPGDSARGSTFTVTDFGAIADGKTDNSKAFMEAWKEACGSKDGVLIVPGGMYLLKGVEFEGPCNGDTEFQMSGTLVASIDPLTRHDYWIMFAHVAGLTVCGDGTFDGNGAATWAQRQFCNFLNDDNSSSSCNEKTPTSIKLVDMNDTIFHDITSTNSKLFHLQIHDSRNISVQNVNITAPENSPNTDGIHIGRSNDIKITNAVIGTGDDCISIGEGSTNVNVTGVWCGPGHGISIGSLGKYKREEDVRWITIKNCTLTNTTNGLRIKTWAPSPPSMASNITFVDIVMTHIKNPIVIDQYYCPHSSCTHQGDSSVAIKDVKFVNIQGSSTKPTAINIECSKSRPCEDIEFSGLGLTYNGQPTGASCSNADDKFIGSDQVPSSCSSPTY